MRKLVSRWVVVCLLVFGAVACRHEGTGDGASESARTTSVTATDIPTPDTSPCATNPKCPNSPGSQCLTKIDERAADIPVDTCSNAEGGQAVQQQVNIFAWNEFVALNWPANLSDCTPNRAHSIKDVKSQDGTFVVWQTYMPGNDVFVAGNKQPAAWCGGNGLAEGANRIIGAVAKADPHVVEFDPALARVAEPEEDVQASGPSAILVDQSGRWVRYERLMNRKEYDFIVSKNLYRAATLQSMANQGQDVTLPAGTIEVKAAWKVLTPAELTSGRFFTTRARVNNTPGGTVPNACDREPVWLGLVGLHIIHKTPTADLLVWSTFEHVDNDKIFYNSKIGGSVQANQLPKPPTGGRFEELSAPPECKPLLQPTQVQRVTPPSADPKLNDYYRNLLKGSVFENYRLIGTTFEPGGPAGNFPAQVANITMETYAQIQTTQFLGATWTGCFGCHINAGTTFKKPNGQNQLTNQSFFFLEVKK